MGQDIATQTETRLGHQGRVLIPARLRHELHFEPGDTLIARVEDERLILEKTDAVKRRLRARYAKTLRKSSLADELVAERREEAKREANR